MELNEFLGCCGAKILWDFRHDSAEENHDEAQILGVLNINVKDGQGEIVAQLQDIKAFTAITSQGQTTAENLLKKCDFNPVASWTNPGTKSVLTLWFRRPNLTKLPK